MSDRRLSELPVRCDSGHFYLTPASVLNIGIGVRMRLQGVRYGPCPVCGDEGLVEDGAYCKPANLRQRLRMALSVLWRGYV